MTLEQTKAQSYPWSLKAKAWYTAMRPKALTCGVMPVLIGTLTANVPLYKINWPLAFSTLMFPICIQIGMHYINDALDYQKGVDTSQKLNKKMIQSGLLSMRQIFAGGIFFLFLAFLFGLPMIYYGGPVFAGIVAVSITCAYIYTGGPYPLSYYGTGDLFAFVFFGLVATGASAYLQQGYVNWISLLGGAQIGLLALTLMSLNNFRDFREDRKAHKRTLTVRLGLNFARWQITVQLLLPFLLNIIWYAQGYVLTAALTTVNLPLALNIIRGTWTYDPGKVFNRYLIETAFVHMMFGVLLILGYHLQ